MQSLPRIVLFTLGTYYKQLERLELSDGESKLEVTVNRHDIGGSGGIWQYPGRFRDPREPRWAKSTETKEKKKIKKKEEEA